MMQGLYISATGMKTHSSGMQVISNNLANVSTVAYKQQQFLFQDLMYQEVPTGAPVNVAQSKKGLGATLEAVRTNHSKLGPFEPGAAATDLAISGKGFFQVVDDASGQAYYTRAGNFRFDADGVLRNPQGLSVSGYKVGKDGKVGSGLEPVSINFKDQAVATSPAQATSQAKLFMNVNAADDLYVDDANPYFSLLGAWDGTATPPIGAKTQSIPVSIYDADGNKRELTLYFDAATTDNGQKTVEYILTMDPALDGSGAAGTEGAGLLMAGTMTFSTAGQMLNMSAFTPGGGDLKDLTNWKPATLVDGLPQVSFTFDGKPAQTISMNMGATGGAWNSSIDSAADVGDVLHMLPGFADVSYGSQRTTGLPKSTALSNYSQDGYPIGDLYNVFVSADGMVTGEYSNGQILNLFQIPLCRFTSEDGLRSEGNNLYAATKDSGNMSVGTAGTENYGEIQGNSLEGSNVDMAAEMTNMIIIQRGFQSNSKAITTWDTMIQKALELKRQ